MCVYMCMYLYIYIYMYIYGTNPRLVSILVKSPLSHTNGMAARPVALQQTRTS